MRPNKKKHCGLWGKAGARQVLRMYILHPLEPGRGPGAPLTAIPAPGDLMLRAPPAPLTSPHIVAVFVLLFSISLLFCSFSYLFVYLAKEAALTCPSRAPDHGQTPKDSIIPPGALSTYAYLYKTYLGGPIGR